MAVLHDDELGILSNAAIPEEIRKTLAAEIMAAKRDASQQSASYLSVAKNPTVAVAIVGILSVFANFAVSYVLNGQAGQKDREIESLRATIALQQASERDKAEAQKAEREFSYRIIEREMTRATDSVERAQVLYFLSSVGMLKGLDNTRLEDFARQELENQGKDVAKIGVPSTLGFSRPDYAVPTIEGTSNGAKLLNVAIVELNQNFLEDEAPQIIKKYWEIFGSGVAAKFDINTAWSAAFVSWVIREARIWPDFKPAAANVDIWNQGLRQKKTFLAGERPVEPGDIVVSLKTGPARCEMEKIRQGLGNACPGASAIVYTVDGEGFRAIMGNAGNAVRLVNFKTDDQRIIGFVRP